MGRAKRMERVVALTKILVDHPQHLFSFSYFCKKFEVAKSTLSWGRSKAWTGPAV